MGKTRSHLSANLKFLRKLKGISQQKLGDDLDMSRNRIAAYESGLTEPNHQNFINIARYFSVEPQVLLLGPLDSHLPNSFLDNKSGNQQETIGDIVQATREVSKIVEGYRTFYEMQEEKFFQDSVLKALMGQLYNVLDLIDKLLEVNFDLINKLYLLEEEE